MNDIQCQMALDNMHADLLAYIRRYLFLHLSESIRVQAKRAWFPWTKLTLYSVANFIEYNAYATFETDASE